MSEPVTATVIDDSYFRRVLGQYPTGVCVITATGPDGRPAGMTAGSFTSVSLDPPLVAFLPRKGSRVFATIAQVRRFAVNILAGDQVALCRHFASRESDKFRSVSWRPSPLGSPVLADALAWIDCRLHTVFEVGDHMMVVGAVDGLAAQRAAAPLMFFQGGYGRFAALPAPAAGQDDLGGYLRLAELAGPKLARLAASFGVQTAASALAGDQVIQLAWAGAGDADMKASLVGLRLPFAAPFGLVFAAWEPEPAQDRWLSRHSASDATGALARKALLGELRRARRQGWSAVPDHAKLREIESSISRIAAAGQLPDAIRQLDTQIAEFAREYAALADGRPRGVSVPVFDHAGHVALALTAQRLPDIGHETLKRCREALVAAGRELTEAIRGTPRAG